MTRKHYKKVGYFKVRSLDKYVDVYPTIVPYDQINFH